MGLLAITDTGKIPGPPVGLIVGNEIRNLIADFHQKNSLFHLLLFRSKRGNSGTLHDIREMTACHGAECVEVSGGDCLVLLPGVLDMELFLHRLSASSGSDPVYRLSANSSSAAIAAISRYLQ